MIRFVFLLCWILCCKSIILSMCVADCNETMNWEGWTWQAHDDMEHIQSGGLMPDAINLYPAEFYELIHFGNKLKLPTRSLYEIEATYSLVINKKHRTRRMAGDIFSYWGENKINVNMSMIYRTSYVSIPVGSSYLNRMNPSPGKDIMSSSFIVYNTFGRSRYHLLTASYAFQPKLMTERVFSIDMELNIECDEGADKECMSYWQSIVGVDDIHIEDIMGLKLYILPSESGKYGDVYLDNTLAKIYYPYYKDIIFPSNAACKEKFDIECDVVLMDITDWINAKWTVMETNALSLCEEFQLKPDNELYVIGYPQPQNKEFFLHGTGFEKVNKVQVREKGIWDTVGQWISYGKLKDNFGSYYKYEATVSGSNSGSPVVGVEDECISGMHVASVLDDAVYLLDVSKSNIHNLFPDLVKADISRELEEFIEDPNEDEDNFFFGDNWF